MNGSGLTGTGNSSANTLITLGANTLVGGGGNDTFEFFAGSANGATVADFDRSEGDVLVFSGFGTEAQGATFTQIGSTDQWQIHSGLDTTHNETITFSNHAAPQCRGFLLRVRRASSWASLSGRIPSRGSLRHAGLSLRRDSAVAVKFH